jgi:hypothetical protein
MKKLTIPIRRVASPFVGFAIGAGPSGRTTDKFFPGAAWRPNAESELDKAAGYANSP